VERRKKDKKGGRK